MEQKTQKKLYFEIMRVLAAFFVIYNHLPAYHWYMISNTKDLTQGLYMLTSVITRFNVPVFFMISGALLLKKQETPAQVLKKRISRFAVVLVLFNFIMFYLSAVLNLRRGAEQDWNPGHFLTGMLGNQIYGTIPYWFLYAYLAFLVMLPLLQKLVRQMTKQDMRWLFAVHFVIVSLIPAFNALLSAFGVQNIALSQSFQVPIAVQNAIFFPILGDFLDQVDLKAASKKWFGSLAAVSLGGILITMALVYAEGICTGTFTQNYISVFDYTTAAGAFILIKYLVVRKPEDHLQGKTGKVIQLVGSLTMGIYLMDPILHILFYDKYELKFVMGGLPILVSSLGWCVFSMTAGGIAVWIMKKVPGLKKIL